VNFNEKAINILTTASSTLCFVVLCYAVYTLPIDKIDTNLIVFSVVTIFLSSKLQIQIPRTKTNITVSQALILVAILLYGLEIAVIIAFLNGVCYCLSLYLKGSGVSIKPTTAIINISIATISTFFTAFAAKIIFQLNTQDFYETTEIDVQKFLSVLVVMVIAEFLASSILVSVFYSFKNDSSFWAVWKGFYLNCLVACITYAVFAGLIVKAVNQTDFIMLFSAIGVISVIFMIYKYFIKDVRETSEKAEKSEGERLESERNRAEQAEKHIKELEHHIAEQLRISQALRESKEKFRHSAFHDALTDLPNRNYFSQEVKFMLEKTKILYGFNFAVLFLDMNRFKTVNDSLGHSIGDRLIINVAKRLKSIVRKGDMVSRFSGDEFAILLSSIKDNDEVSRYAEMIQKKISTPFTISGKQIFTSVSIGVVVGGSDYEDSQDILRDADIAMYKAKEKGESHMFFDPAMHSQTIKLLQLETDLRYAVARQEFLVFYQPIIDLQTMKIKGFEALMRWNHPERGLVAPYEFIPICEDTGMIIPLTIWILKTSCLQVKQWQQSNPEYRNLMISVNLSGKHFSNQNLVEQIWTVLTETDFNPQQLKLEITESAVMENAENAIAVLKELKELGIQLSIDDFGTGYSSLSYLHRFPIDTLKIDRSFVNSMTEGSDNGEFVQTIMTLAHTLNLAVIAEGIETINQLHQLRILGCEYGQGFLFSRPVPKEEIDKLLENQSAWDSFRNPTQITNQTINKEVPHLRLAK
jgi:diguanylate cyclase (GGDEF)-like protein